jgi:hypothetical protein
MKVFTSWSGELNRQLFIEEKRGCIAAEVPGNIC